MLEIRFDTFSFLNYRWSMSRASEFLWAQYSNRKAKNPGFSQRAFARHIGISSGLLTHYLNEKRPITKKAAQLIAKKLHLDSTQRDYFVYLCELEKNEKRTPSRILTDDELALTVEWYHFAILSLFSTKDFKFDNAWIANRLGIPKALVASSLDRLVRMNFIKIENGKVHLMPGTTSTPTGSPNKFVQMAHQEMLRHIETNIPRVPLEKRDLSSITLAVNEDNLEEAKTMIRAFRRRLATRLYKGKKNQVYTINIQLFPLTQEI